jgi:hypothetical protein
LTTRPRNLQLGDSLAWKALEIVRYLKPRRWWLENPRNGLLKTRWYMQGLPFVDADYCQYINWGYQKPTRIWGSADLLQVATKLCDGITCPNLAEGKSHHRIRLSSPHQNLSANIKYRVPEDLVRQVARFHTRADVRAAKKAANGVHKATTPQPPATPTSPTMPQTRSPRSTTQQLSPNCHRVRVHSPAVTLLHHVTAKGGDRQLLLNIRAEGGASVPYTSKP